jgi:aminopeptidase N
VYWNYLSSAQRKGIVPRVESLLWGLFTGAADQGVAAKYFDTYLKVFLTPKAVKRVKKIWQKSLTFKNFSISPRKYTEISLELAVREIKGSPEILQEQLKRIKNPDRKKRLQFIIPALSPEAKKRDLFFNSLKEVKNRQVEPWVTTALRYLHHPLRREQSLKYIMPSLELLEEIRVTGDIFFPITWLGATLGSHNTPAAARIVETFLKKYPDYPINLKQKILQAGDPLFRAAGRKEISK